MVKISESFYEIHSDQLENIGDGKTSLYIGLIGKGKGFRLPVGQREFYLVGSFVGVVLSAQAAPQYLGFDDFPPFQVLQQGYLIKKESVEIMIDIDADVMIVDEFQEVHEIIGIQLIGIGLVGMGDIGQGKRHFPDQVASVHGKIRITQLGKIEPLEEIQVEIVIIVFPAKQAFNSGDIPEGDDGIFIEDGHAVELTDIELLV